MSRFATPLLAASLLFVAAALPEPPAAPADEEKEKPSKPLPPRHVEKLGRGVVAVHEGGGKVFVSWRLLGTDPDGVAFHVYRALGDADPVRLTKEPLTKATHFADTGVEFEKPVRYVVRPVV